MVLSCPHCDQIIEVVGEPRSFECECGALMEPFEGDGQVDAQPLEPVGA